MTPRQRAEKVYCQYWEDVNKENIKPTDPLPDIRPLLEQAINDAIEDCAKVADDVLASVDPECYEAAYKRVVAMDIRGKIRALKSK
jgi:hypothetical protein